MIALKVSEVFSPDNFFIQHQDDKNDLNKLLTDLSRYYIRCEHEGSLDNLRVPSMDCQLGMWIAAVWDKDDYWYRAKIIKITSLTTVELQFVDFGNRMSCKKSELYKLVDPFIQENVPAFASQAKLTGIKPAVGKKFCKAASDMFQRLTHDADLVGQIIERRSNENGKLEVKLSVKDEKIDVSEHLIKERVAMPRIKEEAGNAKMKFPRDLPNMLDDLTLKLSSCEGPNTNRGHVLATVKGLQEEMNELRRLFLTVDEKNVQCVLKKQVKLAKKILIMGTELCETQDNENDESDDDSGIYKG